MTENEFKIKQALPLELKIQKFEKDMIKFYQETNYSYYVAFSGGKDSSVGLRLIIGMYIKGLLKKMPKIVFSNTGQEYKGIVEQVNKFKEFYNVEIDVVRPKIYKTLQEKGLSPNDLWRYVGFPVVSKQVSMAISRYRRAKEKCLEIIEKGKKEKLTEKDIKNLKLFRESMRGRLFGIRMKNGNRGFMGIIPKKWRYFINAPYKISNNCCTYLKHEPMETYAKQNNLLGAVVFTRADESQSRKSKVLENGCIIIDHDKENYLAKPLSIWTDKNIDDCIKMYEIPLSKEYTVMGMKRTGCRSCPFGCHLEPKTGKNRYQINHEFYPREHEHDMVYMGMGQIVSDMGVSWNRKYSIVKGNKQYKLF